MTVADVKSREAFDAAVKSGKPVAVHFWATWCEPCVHMDGVFAQLAADNPGSSFIRVEAEEVPEVSDAYAVSAVPFFLFFKNGKLVDQLQGANAPELTHKVGLHVSTPAAATNFGAGASAAADVIESVLKSARSHTTSTSQTKPSADSIGAPAGSASKLSPDLKARLDSLLASAPVLLFMKGSADAPRCRFSSKVVAALEKDLGPASAGKFRTFDILADEEVRQGLKVLSDWPTFPQLYCEGELVGGCDIVLQMHESGELKELFREKGVGGEDASGGLKERLTALVSSQSVMLFMKGTPEEPRCGFSRKVVDALRSEKVQFGSFDILSDDAVREGLKKLSDWPTYPQLYHKGELLGGCDIIMEMKENGELGSALSA